jgi:hypothetical protein
MSLVVFTDLSCREASPLNYCKPDYLLVPNIYGYLFNKIGFILIEDREHRESLIHLRKLHFEEPLRNR